MSSGAAEAEEFLRQNPDIEWVDAFVPDINGVPRGKRLAVGSLPKLFDQGILLPTSLIVSSYEGETVEETGYGLATGDEDSVCTPIAGSLARSPNTSVPTAQIMLSMSGKNGSAVPIDPRATLSRVVENLGHAGYTATVAIELECYLIDVETDQHGRPLPPRPPNGGRRLESCQLYGLEDLEAFSGVLQGIAEACRSIGIAVTTAISEYGPGQIEVNLPHCSDPVKACDQAILFKRTVRSVARQAGIDATFMAKPYRDSAGSGMHVHVSLNGLGGKSVFADPTLVVPDKLRHAVGGTLSLMGDSLGLFVPNANGFRRLRPGSFAPNAPNWGVDNRTVAVRIPNSDAKNRRLEHRLASADANPYLVVAAILSAVQHGIENSVEPGPVTAGDGYETEAHTGWDSWAMALDRLAGSELLREIIGEDQIEAYTTVKKHERVLHLREIPPIDHRWHL